MFPRAASTICATAVISSLAFPAHFEILGLPISGDLRTSTVAGESLRVFESIVSVEATSVSSTVFCPTPFSPKTALGKALWAARQRIIKSGEPLAPAQELLQELAKLRRG
jgi:hypothetical protein